MAGNIAETRYAFTLIGVALVFPHAQASQGKYAFVSRTM